MHISLSIKPASIHVTDSSLSLQDYRKAVETDESFKGILSKFGEKVTEVKRTHVKFNVAKPYQG